MVTIITLRVIFGSVSIVPEKVNGDFATASFFFEDDKIGEKSIRKNKKRRRNEKHSCSSSDYCGG